MNAERRAAASASRQTMKKRLRKKLHLGEFLELGFEIIWRFRPGVDLDTVSGFFDAYFGFTADLDLHIAGSANSYVNNSFISPWRGSATQEHRRRVMAWLESRPEIDRFHVGDMEDVWRDWRKGVRFRRRRGVSG